MFPAKVKAKTWQKKLKEKMVDQTINGINEAFAQGPLLRSLHDRKRLLEICHPDFGVN